MERFDLVVIGAGPSGYAAAMRAIDFKKKTLLIEKSKVGGAGVTNGALSSKTWWELAREVSAFRKNLKRYNIKAPTINFKEIQDEVRKAVHERKSMLEEHMEMLKTSNYSQLLQFKTGTASLLDQNQVEIVHGAQTQTVWAEHIILATGSRPRYLPDLPIDEKIVMTSDGIENMDDFPREHGGIVGARGLLGANSPLFFLVLAGQKSI